MIPLFKVFMPESVMEPLQQTLMSGYIGQGVKVDAFEAKLSEWIGCPRVLTLNSCTSAIQLALRLANVSFGDEVISTPMTCTATNEPILAFGAKIVWADVNPKTGNLDPLDIERKINKKTKAIIMVHWGGYPCEIDAINTIAQRHGLKVIEDAAHAFGSTYKGKKIGNHSDFICFSFQAIKHLTTVDGGALICKNAEDHKRGKLLRWYGINREGSRKDFRCEEDVVEYGYKFHMNDVAATIGLEQIKQVDGIIRRHRGNAVFYDEELKKIKGIEITLREENRLSSYWIYTLLTDKKQALMGAMNEQNIQVSSVHARNDQHTMFKDFKADLPGVTEFTRRMVCIPVGWWVTDEDRKKVVEAIKNF